MSALVQRHRGESDCLSTVKSGGFHREGEAFDLDCQKMNQNSSGPKDEKVF